MNIKTVYEYRMTVVRLRINKKHTDMKRTLLFFLLSLLILPWAVSATRIDGINYKFNSDTKTATVCFERKQYYSGDIVIPSSVTYEDIEYSVTMIESGAFRGSTDLTSITIPNSVTSIGLGITSGCTSVTSIIIEEGNPVYDSRDNCNAIIETASNSLFLGCKGTIVPNGVTTIGESAFEGCSGLTSVYIPNSVTTFGKNAFKDCSNLKKVELNNNALVSKDNQSVSPTPITSIFGNQVEEYVIGEDVTRIGNYAFLNSQNLTSVSMSNSITSIGEGAFSHCIQLTTIKMSDNLTSIGNNAFIGCYHLTSMTIPSGVTNIDLWAFGGCGFKMVVLNSNAIVSKDYGSHSSLSEFFGPYVKEFVLGEGITRVGNYAFGSCKFEDMYCYAEQVPETGSDVFIYSNYTNATLHVPAGSLEAYSNAEQWKDFKEIVSLTDDPNPNGIQIINSDVMTGEHYYSLDGKHTTTPQRGLNIIRMRNGTTKKIVIK